MQCPECHAENPASNKFCGMCGGRLAKKARLEPNPYFSDRVGEEPMMKQEFAGPDVRPGVGVAEVEESYAAEQTGYPQPMREYRVSPPAEVVAAAEPKREPPRKSDPVVVREPARVLPVHEPARIVASEAGRVVPVREPEPVVNRQAERMVERHPEPVAPVREPQRMVAREQERIIPLREAEPVVARETERIVARQPEPVAPVREPDLVLTAPEPQRVVREPEPVYMGAGSLLGLGAPVESLHSDVEGDNASYLLDERPRRTVSWRAWALLAILIGLGYLGYREWAQNHNSSRPDLSKVLAQGGQATPPDTPVSNSTSSPSAAPSSTPSSDANGVKKPESDAGTTTPSTTTSSNSAPVAKTDAPRADTTAPNAARSIPPATITKASKPDAAKSTNTSEDDESADLPAAKPKQSKKAAEERAAPAVDYGKDPMFTRAMQYIHGRPQNCEMGMNYLRAAADSNPRARIQMAALYQSGVCVPMDRAQAYSWYSKAQELDPHNMYLEKNRSRLWEEMSAGERARAR